MEGGSVPRSVGDGPTILLPMPGNTAPPNAGASQATAQTTTLPASALGAGGEVGPSEADVHAELDELFRSRASIDGRIVAPVLLCRHHHGAVHRQGWTR